MGPRAQQRLGEVAAWRDVTVAGQCAVSGELWSGFASGDGAGVVTVHGRSFWASDRPVGPVSVGWLGLPGHEETAEHERFVTVRSWPPEGECGFVNDPRNCRRQCRDGPGRRGSGGAARGARRP